MGRRINSHKHTTFVFVRSFRAHQQKCARFLPTSHDSQRNLIMMMVEFPWLSIKDKFNCQKEKKNMSFTREYSTEPQYKHRSKRNYVEWRRKGSRTWLDAVIASLMRIKGRNYVNERNNQRFLRCLSRLSGCDRRKGYKLFVVGWLLTKSRSQRNVPFSNI